MTTSAPRTTDERIQYLKALEGAHTQSINMGVINMLAGEFGGGMSTESNRLWAIRMLELSKAVKEAFKL